MRKLSVILIAFLGHLPSAAYSDEACEKMLAWQEEVNAKAPMLVDNATEFMQVSINCEGRTIAYVKRVLALEGDLNDGWRERQLLKHHQLHCNSVGLARSGWTVIDKLYDVNFDFLIEYRTGLDDC